MLAGPDELLAAPEDLAVLAGVPADDPKLIAALRAASRRFRGAVRHPVSLVTGDTVYLDGNGLRRLHLPAAPIVTVHQVQVDGDAVTDYRAKRRAGVLLRDGGGVWPDWSEVLVTYDHGFVTVPEDIQEVVIDQARALYRVEPGVQTIQAGGESITYGAQAAVGVSAQWSAVVDAYRLNRGDSA